MSKANSSTRSSGASLLPLFSHLYVESDLLAPPWEENTKSVLSRFSRAQTITVGRYGEVVQRRWASWNDQKRSPKLVLALKRSDLIYPCSDVAPNFGHRNFYYAVPMQNCLYDCEYCYLQGMYTSPNMVYFVNQSDMIEAARRKARELGDLYICIAYDNDILALESLLGVARTWVEGLREDENVTVEVRTKSANVKPLRELPAAPNFIFAWTLSPPAVIERFEAKTPPLEARVKALKEMLERGWRVRLCFDPLLPILGWEEEYRRMLALLDASEVWSRLEDVSYGLFRMPKPFLRQAKKARPDSALLHAARSKEERGLFTLTGTDQDVLLDFMGRSLRERLGPSQVWKT